MYVASKVAVRAHKQHTCCECNGPVYIGQRHELITAKKEGAWIRYRTHIECTRLREALWQEAKEDPPIGELYEVVDRLADAGKIKVEDGILYRRV